MSKIPVYVCNRKKCLICRGAICGRTTDKDYAALNENGHPKIDGYIPFEDPERTWQSFKGGGKVTYWEAADIIEHGSLDYGKLQEAYAIASMVLKERIKKLDEAEDAKFREVPVKGPLYGTKSDVIFVDEFVGEEEE